MKKNLAVIFFMLVWASVCSAQNLLPAKILDVRAYSEPGAPIIAPNNGHPVLIPVSSDMFSLTLVSGHMTYTAQYSVSRHLKPADLIVGDSVPARIDGKKMVVEMPDHKIRRAIIIRKERLSPETAQRWHPHFRLGPPVLLSACETLVSC
jgi:hypothetical protein